MAKGFLASDYRYALTAVRFRIDDAGLQHVYDRCEALCPGNDRQSAVFPSQQRISSEDIKPSCYWIHSNRRAYSTKKGGLL